MYKIRNTLFLVVMLIATALVIYRADRYSTFPQVEASSNSMPQAHVGSAAPAYAHAWVAMAYVEKGPCPEGWYHVDPSLYIDNFNARNHGIREHHCEKTGEEAAIVVVTPTGGRDDHNVPPTTTITTVVPPTTTPVPPTTTPVPPTTTPVPPTTPPTEVPPTEEPAKEKANCGVGNGVDGDTKGCPDGSKDGEGTGPGNPGAKGGNNSMLIPVWLLAQVFSLFKRENRYVVVRMPIASARFTTTLAQLKK
jgi:hypothetical protein